MNEKLLELIEKYGEACEDKGSDDAMGQINLNPPQMRMECIKNYLFMMGEQWETQKTK